MKGSELLVFVAVLFISAPAWLPAAARPVRGSCGAERAGASWRELEQAVSAAERAIRAFMAGGPILIRAEILRWATRTLEGDGAAVEKLPARLAVMALEVDGNSAERACGAGGLSEFGGS
jgi:hypothetical protein